MSILVMKREKGERSSIAKRPMGELVLHAALAQDQGDSCPESFRGVSAEGSGNMSFYKAELC